MLYRNIISVLYIQCSTEIFLFFEQRGKLMHRTIRIRKPGTFLMNWLRRGFKIMMDKSILHRVFELKFITSNTVVKSLFL